ncbi:MAG: hypothetical protein ACOCVZ_00640 [Gemmatimonadota bacterium]
MRQSSGPLRGALLVLAVVAIAVAVAAVLRDRGPARGPEADAGGPGVEDTGTGATREPVPAAAAEEIRDRVEEMRSAVRRYERACLAGLDAAGGPGFRGVVMDCVDGLASSVDAVVAADTVGRIALDERMDRYRRELSNLQAVPPGEGSAAATRRVLTSMAELLERVRDERFTETLADTRAVEEAEEAARSLEADRSLTAQRHRVRRFFLAAGAVLNAMARPGA